MSITELKDLAKILQNANKTYKASDDNEQAVMNAVAAAAEKAQQAVESKPVAFSYKNTIHKNTGRPLNVMRKFKSDKLRL
jgi:hypothetical protein